MVSKLHALLPVCSVCLWPDVLTDVMRAVVNVFKAAVSDLQRFWHVGSALVNAAIFLLLLLD